MTIENYLSQPESERKEIVQYASLKTSPFWLCQLQTAVNTSNPLAVMFNKKLVAEYWTLKSQN